MKVRTVITTEIDLAAVYQICTPIDRRACSKAIRDFVDGQIDMRANSDEGWQYPDDEMIASHLIELGLATSLST